MAVVILVAIYVFVMICFALFPKYQKFRHSEHFTDSPSAAQEEPVIDPAAIPKVIYTYWHHQTIPEFVNRCILTWKVNNPNYEVCILSMQDVRNAGIDKQPVDVNNAKLMSDLMCLYILSEYGGIWLDPYVVCTGSLDWVHSTKPNDKDIVAYVTPEKTIDGCFIASKQDSEFMTKWYSNYGFSIMDEIVRNATKSNNGAGNTDTPNYFNISSQKTLQDLEVGKLIFPLNIEDGPYKYLLENNWDTDRSVKYFCSGEFTKYPFVKFRENDRTDPLSMVQLFSCVFPACMTPPPTKEPILQKRKLKKTNTTNETNMVSSTA